MHILHVFSGCIFLEKPRHGKDSTLRQWGLSLAPRGAKQSRNRAIVAMARKLAVLLHRIWVTQQPYIPFYAKAA
jgi:transposase